MKKLELLNLTKSFSSFKALSNVSIELLSGETHALMGENGAGNQGEQDGNQVILGLLYLLLWGHTYQHKDF